MILGRYVRRKRATLKKGDAQEEAEEDEAPD
jgi:hypothetical protein